MKTGRLLLNTGSNYVILLLRIVMTFVLTPLYVKFLGVYDFGIWELVVATLGYAGLLDLGLGFSISRFIAKYRAEDNHEALLKVFNTVTAFLTSIGLLLALVALGIALWAPELLAPASGAQRPYSLFLSIIALQAFISFPGVVAGGCLDGYQKYYVKNFLTFLDSIFVVTVTLLFINKDNALILLASLSTFSLLWKCMAYWVLLAREPDYPLYFDRRYLSGPDLACVVGVRHQKLHPGSVQPDSIPQRRVPDRCFPGARQCPVVHHSRQPGGLSGQSNRNRYSGVHAVVLGARGAGTAR